MDKKSVDMKKKGIDFEVEDNRSEIKGKVKENAKKKVGVVKKTKKIDVDLEQTIALDTVKILREGKAKKHTEEEKRSEIAAKVGGKKAKSASSATGASKKIKSRKIRYDDISMAENQDDKVQENVETVSIAMIAMFVLFCIVVTVVVGYMLYQIALTNSDVMAVSTIFKNWFL